MIYDPFSTPGRCRPTLCSEHRDTNRTDCLRNELRKQVGISANATEATIFVALGVAKDTDWRHLDDVADYNFERRMEEVLRENLAKVLRLHPSRIQNVSVPDFTGFYHNLSMEHRRLEAEFVLDESESSRLVVDKSTLSSEVDVFRSTRLTDSRVEASFVLIRPAESERCPNETDDSLVEMFAKLVNLVTAEESFDFLVDNVTVEVYAIWEEDARGKQSVF